MTRRKRGLGEKGEKERSKTAVSRAYAAVRLPSRGVTLRVISPLRVGRHMAGRLQGAQRRQATGGLAHNFQIYVQMFLAKRPSGRFLLVLSLSLSLSLFGGEDIYRKVSRN